MAVIAIDPKLDFRTAGAFKRQSSKLIEEGCCRFLLDFIQTGIVDSTGLGALFWLQRKVSQLSNGCVVVFRPSYPTRTALLLTGAHRAINIAKTQEEADRMFREKY